MESRFKGNNKTTMRILLVSSSSGSKGGGEIFLRYLAKGLSEAGHTVGFWCSTQDQMDTLAESISPYAAIIRSPYPNLYTRKDRGLLKLDAGMSSAIQGSWLEWSPDIIHINKQNLEDGNDLLEIANAVSSRVITTIHITQTARELNAVLAPLRDRKSRKNLRRSSGPLICVSENRTDALAAFIGNTERCHCVHNGVEDFEQPKSKQILDALSWSQEHLIFTCVARLVEQKNPMLFLHTAQEILGRISHARFLWIGDGPMEGEWDDLVESKQLETKIKRIGWQNNIPSWLAATDIYLHTAAFEGLPLSILEALSASLPCIITDNIIEESPTLNYPSIIPLSKYASQLDELCSPGHRESAASLSRALFEDKFSIASMVEAYEFHYMGLMNS